MNLIFYIERIFTLGKSCSLYVRVDNALSLDYIMYILEWRYKLRHIILNQVQKTIMVNNLWRKNHDE